MNRNRFLTKVNKDFQESIFSDIVTEQVEELKKEINQQSLPYILKANPSKTKKQLFEKIITEQINFIEKYLKVIDYSFGINNEKQRIAIQFNETILSIEHVIISKEETYLSMFIDEDELKRTNVVNSIDEFEKDIILLLREMFSKAFSAKSILEQEESKRNKHYLTRDH